MLTQTMQYFHKPLASCTHKLFMTHSQDTGQSCMTHVHLTHHREKEVIIIIFYLFQCLVRFQIFNKGRLRQRWCRWVRVNLMFNMGKSVGKPFVATYRIPHAIHKVNSNPA